MITQTRI